MTKSHSIVDTTRVNTQLADALSAFIPPTESEGPMFEVAESPKAAVEDVTEDRRPKAAAEIAVGDSAAQPETIIVEVPPVAVDVEETSVAQSPEVQKQPRVHHGKGPVRGERRAMISQIARKMVAEGVPGQTVPQKSQPAKLEWDFVPFRQFVEFDTMVLAVIISAIQQSGRKAVVSLEIDVMGAYSRVDFGLSVLNADKDIPRVEMRVLGGEGNASVYFAGQRFFRDELFGQHDVPPARSASTRGLRGYLEMVLSMLEAQSAR